MFEEILGKINQNKEWIFSGIGVLVLSTIIGIVKLIITKQAKKSKSIFKQIIKGNSQGTQIGIQLNQTGEAKANEQERK